MMERGTSMPSSDTTLKCDDLRRTVGVVYSDDTLSAQPATHVLSSALPLISRQSTREHYTRPLFRRARSRIGSSTERKRALPMRIADWEASRCCFPRRRGPPTRHMLMARFRARPSRPRKQPSAHGSSGSIRTRCAARKSQWLAPATSDAASRRQKMNKQIEEFTSRCNSHLFDINARIRDFDDPRIY
jgi:hypothetical protein